MNQKPSPLEKRFPYLQREIRMLMETNPDFRQLSDDYELLNESLSAGQFESDCDRDEILELKTSLEFEALEKLSHITAAR